MMDDATMLPDGWHISTDRSYYYSIETKQSQRERPSAVNANTNSSCLGRSVTSSHVVGATHVDDDVPILPAGWEELIDEVSGCHYFYNSEFGEASWEPPCAAKEGASANTALSDARATNSHEEQDRPSGSLGMATGTGSTDESRVKDHRSFESMSSDKGTAHSSWWPSISLGGISSLASTVSSALWRTQSGVEDDAGDATHPTSRKCDMQGVEELPPQGHLQQSVLRRREAFPGARMDDDLFATPHCDSAQSTPCNQQKDTRKSKHRIRQNLAIPVALDNGILHTLRFRVGQRVKVEGSEDGVFMPGTVTAIASQIRESVHSGFLELQMEDGEYQCIGGFEPAIRTQHCGDMASPVYKYHQVAYCVQLDHSNQIIAPFDDDDSEIQPLVGSTIVVDQPALFGPKKDSNLGQRLKKILEQDSSNGDVSMIMCQLMKPVPIGERSPILNKRKCSNCGSVSDFLLGCSKCQIAMYCDPQCQASHWPLHKVACHIVTKLRKQDPRLLMTQVGKKQAMKANLAELLRLFLEKDCSVPLEAAKLLRDLVLRAEDAVAEYYLSATHSNEGPFQDLVLEIIQSKDQNAMRIILSVDCFMCLPAGALYFSTTHPTISDWCRTGVGLFVQISKRIPLKKFQENEPPLPIMNASVANQDSSSLVPASSSNLPLAGRNAPSPHRTFEWTIPTPAPMGRYLELQSTTQQDPPGPAAGPPKRPLGRYHLSDADDDDKGEEWVSNGQSTVGQAAFLGELPSTTTFPKTLHPRAMKNLEVPWQDTPQLFAGRAAFLGDSLSTTPFPKTIHPNAMKNLRGPRQDTPAPSAGHAFLAPLTPRHAPRGSRQDTPTPSAVQAASFFTPSPQSQLPRQVLWSPTDYLLSQKWAKEAKEGRHLPLRASTKPQPTAKENTIPASNLHCHADQQKDDETPGKRQKNGSQITTKGSPAQNQKKRVLEACTETTDNDAAKKQKRDPFEDEGVPKMDDAGSKKGKKRRKKSNQKRNFK